MRYSLQSTSRRGPLRSLVVSTLVAVVSVGALLISGGPASASVSRYHGMWMSQVSGCSSNYRIGKTARLVTDTGVDYGWVEWRASRTGHCVGYQWVRFHISHSLGYAPDEGNYKTAQMYYQKDQWGRGVYTAWKYNQVVHKTRFLKYGNYNSRIFYAPNQKACAEFLNYYKTVRVR
jgi:hypothetical protein